MADNIKEKATGVKEKEDDEEKEDILQYADYWFNTGNQEQTIQQTEGQLGLNVAWGIFEKKSLEHTMYNLWMEFVTFGGEKILDTAIVQTYASFPDPDAPGMSQSFTCSARYTSFQKSASVYEVFNYYGELPFTKMSNGTKDKKYGEINFEDHDFTGPWTADTKDPERIYASTYQKGRMSQACGASRYVFLNHPTFKMDLKRNTSYMVQTGYKIWQDGVLSTELSVQEDGVPFEILFEDTASADLAESGCFSLSLSALALTFLVSNMMF